MRTQVCDSRCHGAKGNWCECWCAGLFHGSMGREARDGLARELGGTLPAKMPDPEVEPPARPLTVAIIKVKELHPAMVTLDKGDGRRWVTLETDKGKDRREKKETKEMSFIDKEFHETYKATGNLYRHGGERTPQYYCPKCKGPHTIHSKIGKLHRKFERR